MLLVNYAIGLVLYLPVSSGPAYRLPGALRFLTCVVL